MRPFLGDSVRTHPRLWVQWQLACYLKWKSAKRLPSGLSPGNPQLEPVIIMDAREPLPLPQVHLIREVAMPVIILIHLGDAQCCAWVREVESSLLSGRNGNLEKFPYESPLIS